MSGTYAESLENSLVTETVLIVIQLELVSKELNHFGVIADLFR